EPFRFEVRSVGAEIAGASPACLLLAPPPVRQCFETSAHPLHRLLRQVVGSLVPLDSYVPGHLVTGLLIRENRLGRRLRRGAGAAEDRRRRRRHDNLAGLSSSYGRTWHDRR
ncbi:hypothetical protein C6P46_003902, partial [Rhodotorula mucilaginosa]